MSRDAPWQNGVQVLSLVRDGRFVRSERLEDEGRIQSWVLAGGKGAVEMRGTRRENLCFVSHVPGPRNAGHSLLCLADIDVFPANGHCTVLEGGCSPLLLPEPVPRETRPDDPWATLKDLYRAHLEGA